MPQPHSVPLEEARTAIRNYRTSIENTPLPHLFGFLIEHADIFDALGLDPTKLGQQPTHGKFRVYVGKTNVTGFGDEWHLYLVPVTPAGVDVIPVDTEGMQYVYDFNSPCPATCDVSSPLYNV